MAALVLQHHSEDPHSQVFENLKSHPSELSLASICSGTGAFLGLGLGDASFTWLGRRSLASLAFLCNCFRFESCVATAAANLLEAFGLEPPQVVW